MWDKLKKEFAYFKTILVPIKFEGKCEENKIWGKIKN